MSSTLPCGISFARPFRRSFDWMPSRLLPEGDHGTGGDGGAGQGTGDGASAATAAKPTATQQSAQKYGFPADTAVADMTAEQQAAYYRASKDSWEAKARAAEVSPEELKALRDKAARADALDYEMASDKEKAVADARKAAGEEARNQYLPQLLKSELRAAAVGRVPAEQIDQWVEDEFEEMNLPKFLAADGSVDTAKVRARVERNLQPGKGTRPAGPSASGQGYRPAAKAAPGEQGRAQAERRFGIKATT